MRTILLLLLMAVFTVACDGNPQNHSAMKSPKPKYDDLLTSIDSDGAYIKLKSGEFIKLYSVSNTFKALKISHSQFRRTTSAYGHSNLSNAASGSSFEDIFQSVDKEDFDSFLIKGKNIGNLSIHPAILTINPSSETKKLIMDSSLSSISKGGIGAVSLDFKSIDKKHVYKDSYYYNLSNDNFGVFFGRNSAISLNKRETKDGYQVKGQNEILTGLYSLWIGSDMWWVNIE
ncbi:hypothetical protein [Desulfuromonas sp.]|uniref:hypothetical protein n=1 Tax=Desulfuromonas sp. TaxID=892 RepID=UPI0025BBE156|nr:hypothetical protein [Desulfuromonas sp.]